MTSGQAAAVLNWVKATWPDRATDIDIIIENSEAIDCARAVVNSLVRNAIAKPLIALRLD